MPRFLSPITPNASTTSTGPVKVGDGINVDADGTISVSGGNQKTWYGICESTSNAGTKVVTCSDFVLSSGANIFVLFTTNNTASTTYLDVNNTGAAQILRLSSDATSYYAWRAGEVVEFVYDGTYWRMLDRVMANTSYYGLVRLSNSISSNANVGYAATPYAVNQLNQAKQATLVSGTNIKTINGESILGSGDLAITGGSLLPIGAVIAYSGTIAPKNWLLCNGDAVSRETYADLFNLIGVTYGNGDGSTTFNLPNYQGKFILGSNIIYPQFLLNELNYPWSIQDNVLYKSGNKGIDGTTSTMKSNTFVLTSSGVLTFDWACSSESISYDYGYYSIYKDGALISGTGASVSSIRIADSGTTYPDEASLIYKSVSFNLDSAGEYYIEFSYKKDSSQSKGVDALLVKNIKVTVASTSYGLASTGGEATHKLTANELPKLEGSFATAVPGGHNNYATGVFSGDNTTWSGKTLVANEQSGSNMWGYKFSAGNNQAHNNMPPYLAANFIIKATKDSESGGSNSSTVSMSRYVLTNALSNISGITTVFMGTTVISNNIVTANSSSSNYTINQDGVYNIKVEFMFVNGSNENKVRLDIGINGVWKYTNNQNLYDSMEEFHHVMDIIVPLNAGTTVAFRSWSQTTCDIYTTTNITGFNSLSRTYCQFTRLGDIES